MIQALHLQLEIDNYPSDPKTAAATDLEGHKASIIKSISAHESIISPLRKFPPELLQVIFQRNLLGPCHRDHFYAPVVFKSSLSVMENDRSCYTHLIELYIHCFSPHGQTDKTSPSEG